MGRETKKTYNILGKPTSITYPDGTSEQWIYNLNGTLKTHKDKKGTETHFEWDCLKRLIGKTVISSDGEVLSKEAKTYKGSLLVSETDAAGVKTNYSYDGAGRKIAAEREGRLTTYEYDSLGRESVVKQWHDGNWIASVKIYDFCNQMIDEYREDSSGRIWGRVQTEYDETGNKISEIVHTDEGLSITKTEYNVLNQPTKIIDPLGYATYIDYNFEFRNEFGQRILQKTTVDPKGVQTVETYDVFDRVVRVEKKDPFGQMLSKVDKRFDFVGNLIQEEQTVITPGKDDRTIINLMEYNSANQLTCLIEAAGSNDQRITRYEYNDFGEKEKILKPNGIVLKYTYNALGLVEKLESLNAPEESAICYEYTYDMLKNLISVLDRINNFETQRRYNDHSEMIFEKLGNDLEIFYEKDCLGRTGKISFPYQKEVGYLYQGDHLLQAVYKTSQDEYYANYRYGISGKLKSIHQIGLAGRIGISYDLMGRETSQDSKYWLQSNLIYDETGNLISRDVTDQWGLNHCDYSYDKLDQLVSEEGMASHAYTHDSINNRIAYDGGEIAINDLNQVLTANGKTYAYDLAGNLILDSDSSYLYDALDRLITVIKNEEKYRYIYDSQNRRIAKQKYCKTTSGWSLESTTKFLYQGSCEVGSLEGDTFTSFRALGAGLSAEIGAAFALEIEGVVYAPTHDQSGSVIALVNAQTGDLVHAARYSAFGQVEKSHGLSPPYQFSSKRLDPETGWIYFGRRYYDSSLGRWTTCDPTGYSDGFNLYAYVHNNPLTHFDEYGLFDGYWDPTPEESAMFNAEAQLQGMKYGALQAGDFFFGCTYELGSSLHSEFWGDPNDPNRVIPISQRSFTEIGLLAGGTALELTGEKVWGACGRGVKFLGKKALKIPYVRKTAQVAMRTFDALWKTRKAAKAVQRATPQNTISAKIASVQKRFFGSSVDTKPIWSTTKSRSSVENAYKHWKDHCVEFPELRNSKEYLEKARELYFDPNVFNKTRVNGEMLRYNPSTNTFGAYTKEGIPKTMFRPEDGYLYWEVQ